MPSLDSSIRDVVVGDDLVIRRTIDRTLSGYESGVTVTKAWLTCKASIADGDPGLFQKSITTTDVPGIGQIENDGAGDVNPVIRFDILPADTIAIGTTLRVFDIQAKTAGGLIHTPEKGTIICEDQATLSS